MLWSSAIVAMGQNESQSVLPHPLIFTVGHEGINSDLGCVKEITELGFPNGHIVRMVQ
jgi:hypothetical protein